ncbi:MAG: DUF1282 domain-containing protein [Bacteroidia bacterium]|nr:DUF1282 domain-containing protein [Bacteroidia bacterium]
MENLINRAKNIILQPKTTWEEIKNEETTIQGLLISYVLPLALISAVASFIGYGFIGARVPFAGRIHSMEWGLNQALNGFLTLFLGILISGWVISWLAPKFDTTLSFNDAVKLVAYSYTPAMLGGIFSIIPSLAVLGILTGLYSLYVLYTGFEPITKVSREKTTNYFIISLAVIIGVYIVLGIVLGLILVSAGISGFRY